MISRRFRIAPLILAVCAVPLINEAESPASFAVRIEGRGAPMLLIPGSTSSGAVWDDVVATRGKSHGCRLCARLSTRMGIDRPLAPWPVVNFAAFIAILATEYTVWLPRILRRRFETEMREDPVRAQVHRRRERRTAILGWTLGLTFGTLGLILGMLLTNP